jgi:hypothetical protein
MHADKKGYYHEGHEEYVSLLEPLEQKLFTLEPRPMLLIP